MKTLNNTDHWAYSHQSNLSSLSLKALEREFSHSVCFFRALLSRHLPKELDAKILDIPCGQGRMVYALMAMGYRNVTGYDLDNRRLAVGKKLALPLSEGDAFEILNRCDENSIDCILSMDFLEHLEKPDVIRYLELAHGKITTGGTLVIRTPSADNPFGIRHIFNDFTHKWAATSGVLRQLLTAAGFTSINIFSEAPKPAMRFGIPRKVVFEMARLAADLFIKCLGQGAPRIWTPSMWGVAVKR